MAWPNMDLGVYLFDALTPETGELARTVEDAGFAAAWTAELAHDPFLPHVAAAATTTRLRLGSGVAIAFGRTPMALAEAAWDLSRFSHGRFTLGLGTQVKSHILRRWGGSWDQPVAQLRETVEAIRAIWKSWQTGQRLEHRGKYFKLSLMTPAFNPGPNELPEVPIVLAAVNPRICRLAGEIADGIFVHGFNSRAYVEQQVIPELTEGAARAGRDVSGIRIIMPVMTATGSTPEEVRASRVLLKSQIAFYASTPAYRSILDVHGLGELSDRLRPLAAAQRWNEMPGLITDEIDELFGVTGRIEEIGALSRERCAGLAGEVALYLDNARTSAADYRKIGGSFHAG